MSDGPVGNRMLRVGGAVVALGGILGAAWSFVAAAPAIGIGVYFIYMGWQQRRVLGVQPLLLAATRALGEGDPEAAVAKAREASLHGGPMALHAARLEGQALFALGRLEEAEAVLTRLDKARASSKDDAAVRESGLALRALVHAARGHDEAARRDMDAVRAGRAPTPQALARCIVAEALLAARKDDRAELNRTLSRGRPYFEFTGAQERVLLRAFQRMLRVDLRGAYREAASVAEGSGASGWVARIAPGLATYAAEAQGADVLLAREGPRSERGVSDTLTRDGSEGAHRQRKRVLASIAVVLCAVFLLIVGIDHGNRAASAIVRDGGQPLDTGSHLPFLVAATFVVLGLLVYARVFFATRTMRRLADAAQRAADPNPETRAHGRAVLEAQRHHKMGIIAASATLALVEGAMRAGDFREARNLCATGLEAASRTAVTRQVLAASVTPAFVAHRAFLLAAASRAHEATVELAELTRSYPDYVGLQATTLVVRLVNALHGDSDEAVREVLQARPKSLALTYRNELLLDAAAVAYGLELPRGEGEGERILFELGEDEDLRRWLDQTAGGLRERLTERVGRRGPGPRVAPAGATLEREAEDGEGEESEPARAHS
jgi:uncharacterized membrane protein